MYSEKMCRVCLGVSEELTPLSVRLPGAHKTLEEAINFVVNIHIVLEHGLPDKICKGCESALDVADTFKQRCLESEAMLGHLDKGKGTDECRPKFEGKDQENSEIYSEDTSSLPTVVSCTSLSDSFGVKVENEENVDNKMNITEQENLDNMQDFKAPPSVVKVEISIDEEGFCVPFSNADSKDIKFEPINHMEMLHHSCKRCGRDFPSRDSLASHRLHHRKDAECLKKLKLKHIHPVTAEVTSETKEKESTNSSSATTIKTQARSKSAKATLNAKKNRGKKANSNSVVMKRKINETNKDMTQKNLEDNMLKQSDMRTSETADFATENQLTCKGTTESAKGILICGFCKYTTNNKNYLNSHLKAHAASKRYSCDSCLYITTKIGNYNEHARTHAGDRPYSCNVCQKMFRAKFLLLRHIDKIHPDDRYS